MRLALIILYGRFLIADGFLPPAPLNDVFSNRRTFLSKPKSNLILGMGIRDFLRKKKEGFFDSTSKTSPATAEVHPVVIPEERKQEDIADSEVSEPKSPQRSPMRMGEDPQTKTVDVESLDHTESIQDKINRVKAGRMTASEKQAFLNSVLSTGNSPESRKPLIQPRYDDDDEEVEDDAEVEDLIEDEDDEIQFEDEGYEEYDEDDENPPDRKASPFPADSLIRNLARGQKTDSVVTSDIIEKAQTEAQRKKREYLQMVTDPNRFNNLAAGSSKEAGVMPQSGSTSANHVNPISGKSKPKKRRLSVDEFSPDRFSKKKKEKKETPPPLPSDLGERLGRQAMEHERARQQAEQERRERELKETEATLEEKARLRQEEIQRKEVELREQRRADEEDKRRKEHEKKVANQEQLQGLMKAQEEYWKKKLAKDRGLPHVSGIDDDAPEKDSAVVTEAADSPTQLSSLNDVDLQKMNDSEFLEEQARRKSEINRAKDMQLEKLKALNSPLPSPAPPTHSRFAPRPSVNFEPQQPIKVKTPSPSRGDLGNVVQRESTSYEPLEFKPTKRSGTSKLADALRGLNIGNSNYEDEESSPPKEKAAGSGSKQKAPEKARKPAAVAKKAPIRMTLPLDDDEHEDDGVDIHSNKSMSIGEALKQASGGSSDQSERSKKWGIDMSKI